MSNTNPDYEDGIDVGKFKKPHKLMSGVPTDDDLVAYFKSLEVPLSEMSSRMRAAAREAVKSANTTSASVTAVGSADADIPPPSSILPVPLPSPDSLDEDDLLLVAGAHREAHGRLASLASHKRASRVVEALLVASPGASLVRAWDAIAPYAAYLSCNRHASHVLATLLALAGQTLARARAPGQDLDADSVPSTGAGAAPIPYLTPEAVYAGLVRVAREALDALAPHALQLLYDESATHVLRSLAAMASGAAPEVLAPRDALNVRETGDGGVPVVGANPKQKGRHLREGSGGGSGNGGGGGSSFGIDDVRTRAITAARAFHTRLCSEGNQEASSALRAVVVTLTHTAAALGDAGNGGAPEELGALACDTHAGPTLQLFLRATAGAAPGAARAFARAILHWGFEGLSDAEKLWQADSGPLGSLPTGKRARASAAVAAATADTGTADAAWVDRLLRDPIGSHTVEAVFNYADAPLGAALRACVFRGRLRTLADDGAANFCLQRALDAARGAPDAPALVKELAPHVPALAASRREGVIVALVRLAAAPGVDEAGQKEVLTALAACAGSIGTIGLAALAPPVEKEATAAAAARATRLIAAAAGPMRGDARIARWWLNINGARAGASVSVAPTKSALGATTVAPITLSATGVGVLSAALTLSPSLARHIVDSIAALPSDELASLCGDPMGSRLLIEPLIESPPQELEWARAKIFSALKGHFAALAAGRFGCWVVSKLFTVLDPRRKAAVAKELAAGERSVAGAPGGRAVLRTARIDHYKSNPEGWEAAWTRAASTRVDFAEILGPEPPKKAVVEVDDEKVAKKKAKALARRLAEDASAEAAGVAAAIAAAIAVEEVSPVVAAAAEAEVIVDVLVPEKKSKKRATSEVEVEVEAKSEVSVKKAKKVVEAALAIVDVKIDVSKREKAQTKVTPVAVVPIAATKRARARDAASTDSGDSSSESEGEKARSAQAASVSASAASGVQELRARASVPLKVAPTAAGVRGGVAAAANAATAAAVTAALVALTATQDALPQVTSRGFESDDDDDDQERGGGG